MQKIFLLLAFSLSTATARAQELLYPAKYQVYKIKRSWHINTSDKRNTTDVQTWNVNLVLVTKETETNGVQEVLIYNSTGGEYYRKAVGPPAYTVTIFTTHPEIKRSDSGYVSEIYSDGRYDGQLVPPQKEVDPLTANRPLITWGYDVAGNKVLTLSWKGRTFCSKDDSWKAPPGKISVLHMCRHSVSFYCKPTL